MKGYSFKKMFLLMNGISCKKSGFPFCKILHLLVISSNKGYTNKWNILQKKSFFFATFCITSVNHILINGISCKEVDLFFLQDYTFISVRYLYIMFFFRFM